MSSAGRSRALLIGLAVVGSLAVSAVATGCTTAGTAVTTPFATTPPVLQHGPTYEIKAATISGLGKVLVDGQGITVYMFASDHQGSPSRCYGICAIQWPAVTLPSGWLLRWPDQVFVPGSSPRRPAPTAPPRSPTTDGLCISGRTTSHRAGQRVRP